MNFGGIRRKRISIMKTPTVLRRVFRLLLIVGAVSGTAGLLATGTSTVPSLSGLAAPRPNPGPARIPLAVRVTESGNFVSGLTLQDFEIEASGQSETPDALFLVRKNLIERREGAAGINPDVSRRLVVLFQMTEYHSKIPEALSNLFKSEMRPGDVLEIQTPMKNYKLTADAFAAKTPEVLAKDLASIVKKDIGQGSMGYNSVLREIRVLARRIGSAGRTGLGDTEGDFDDGLGIEMQLAHYGEALQKMEALRPVEQAKLAAFAQSLKSLPGQKTVFFIYQREFRPEITSQALDALVMAYQDRGEILAEVQQLFGLYHRPLYLDPRRLQEAFADADIRFNFLFMNRDPERISGITMREQSEDVFKALSVVAEATGGTVNSSQNPAASMAEALKVSDDYYLLYFTPSVSAPPGTFIDLKVRVKGKDYKVSHRAGYKTGS